jgi:hypothetical protein
MTCKPTSLNNLHPGTEYSEGHYAKSQNVAGSIPVEIIGFFQFTKSSQPKSGTGVDSATNRNEYQKTSWG